MSFIFNKYPSIESSTHKKDLLYFANYLDEHYGNLNITWCITEKIHGSNTGIIYDLDSDSIVVQSRNHILSEDEIHYNAKTLAKELSGSLRIASLKIANLYPDKGIKYITLFGEVYGGVYPDDSVDRDPNALRVQKGIYYSPKNEFRAFDILVGFTDNTTEFLSGEMFFDICLVTNIPTVPLLASKINTLDKALEYPNDGESIIYKLNRLPKLKGIENKMEGVVIRPWNTDLMAGEHRIIIKNKNPEFLEECNSNGVKEVKVLEEKVLNAIEMCSTFTTENRLNNIISHMADPPTIKQFSDVMRAFVTDIMCEFSTTQEYKSLTKDDIKVIQKSISKQAAKLVKAYFDENVSSINPS